MQGVGFRPFVYRLAEEEGVHGFVQNTAHGVLIEIEAPQSAQHRFLSRLHGELPANAHLESVGAVPVAPLGLTGFCILESDRSATPDALVLPDLAPCEACRADVLTPQNRRYRYPFTNCTHCGPRYTIVRELPYDRASTSMSAFRMCAACAREYADPHDRRFHAQPNACPVCGPQLTWLDAGGHPQCAREEALTAAATALNAGAIVAVKGVGGFHLLCDASRGEAIRALRERKRRPHKPFALMFPGMASIEAVCEISALERSILCSPAAPILLAWKREDAPSGIGAGVAPGLPWLGVMLASTPLHVLLLKALGRPIVATSGNRQDEPICIDNEEAVARLHGIADAFLVHDRPILRPVDDSIVRVMAERALVLRRARGYAPAPISLPVNVDGWIALGAQLKNTVAVGSGKHALLSQHIGDLDNAAAFQQQGATLRALRALYPGVPRGQVHDAHPELAAPQRASFITAPGIALQHHAAHVYACMAEHGLHGPLLGIAWDGTGYGEDGLIWGSEAFLVDGAHYERVAHLGAFALPGGDRAVIEPRRVALSLLHTSQRSYAPIAHCFDDKERAVLLRMLDTGLRAPLTTSMGRLFDGLASLLGLCDVMSYEAQAAQAVEALAASTSRSEPLTLPLLEVEGGLEWDWRPLVDALLHALEEGVPPASLARGFHEALAEAVATLAARHPALPVVLTGGCFQNGLLLSGTVAALQRDGRRVYWHEQVPPNDGGIALGQLYYAGLCRNDTED